MGNSMAKRRRKAEENGGGGGAFQSALSALTLPLVMKRDSAGGGSAAEMSLFDRRFVKVSWKEMRRNKANCTGDICVVVEKAWLGVVNRRPAVRRMFLMSEKDTCESADSLMRAAGAAENFFDRLIMDTDLSDSVLRERCQALGAKHCLYFSRGFSTRYWDDFSVCLINAVRDFADEQYGSLRSNRRRRAVVSAWGKLITLVVDQMMVGYREERARLSANLRVVLRRDVSCDNDLTNSVRCLRLSAEVGTDSRMTPSGSCSQEFHRQDRATMRSRRLFKGLEVMKRSSVRSCRPARDIHGKTRQRVSQPAVLTYSSDNIDQLFDSAHIMGYGQRFDPDGLKQPSSAMVSPMRNRSDPVDDES